MYCKGCAFELPTDGGFCWMFSVEPETCIYSKRFYCPACGGEGMVEQGNEEGSCMVECYCNGGFVPAVDE